MTQRDRWRRMRAWIRARASILILVALIALAQLAYLAPDMFITIGAGEAGVLWKRFDGGTRLRERYAEGMWVIAPWDRMTKYDLRLQQLSHDYDVLTSDGLGVKAEITVRWTLIANDLGKLHRDLGPDYAALLIVPVVGAYAREELARHPSDALYSPRRLVIQDAILARTKQALRARYVIVDDVLIRGIVLPPAVRAAIEEKVAQKHLAESYRYRLERESQEAERKAIEASGIRRFQATLRGDISDSYLRWRGIEATLELARSPNAKVVVVGGKDSPILVEK